ncbi:conserved hypothetical protein [Oenococcus oeni]|nr:conserved hypothetical protein [Oenococcus oeni]
MLLEIKISRGVLMNDIKKIEDLIDDYATFADTRQADS